MSKSARGENTVKAISLFKISVKYKIIKAEFLNFYYRLPKIINKPISLCIRYHINSVFCRVIIWIKPL